MAATLDRSRLKQEVTVRCMNLGTEPRELKAGTIIGIYQPIEEDQVEAAEVQVKSILPRACPRPTFAGANMTDLRNIQPVCQTGPAC